MNLNEWLVTMQRVTKRHGERLDELEERAERTIDRQAELILDQAAMIEKLNRAVYLLTQELVARDQARSHLSKN